jgi:Tfp pilus assembly protein PilO
MVTNLKRPFIISLSIILGSAITAAAGLYFLADNISATAVKIVADRADIDKQTGSLGVLAALKGQAVQAETYQAAMDNLLPTQDGLIDFSQWIAGIAAQNQVAANVSFNGNPVAPPPAAPGQTAPGQAPFSLSITGSLNNIIAFLSDIESQTPGFLLRLTSFDLESTNGSYQWSGQGTVFFRQ